MRVVIETERLIVKPTMLADYENLLSLWTDPEVMRYIGDGAVRTKEEVEAFLVNALPYFEEHGLGFFSVFDKQSGEFVGQAGLIHLGFNCDQPDIEVGYRLHQKWWHQGLATELTIGLINYGFNQLRLPKIIAITHPDNIPSQKVLVKSGMSYQGVMDYKNIMVKTYQILNAGSPRDV